MKLSTVPQKGKSGDRWLLPATPKIASLTTWQALLKFEVLADSVLKLEKNIIKKFLVALIYPFDLKSCYVKIHLEN